MADKCACSWYKVDGQCVNRDCLSSGPKLPKQLNEFCSDVQAIFDNAIEREIDHSIEMKHEQEDAQQDWEVADYEANHHWAR